MMICRNCHKEIEDNMNFCKYCGAPVAKPEPQPPEEQQPRQPVQQSQPTLQPEQKQPQQSIQQSQPTPQPVQKQPQQSKAEKPKKAKQQKPKKKGHPVRSVLIVLLCIAVLAAGGTGYVYLKGVPDFLADIGLFSNSNTEEVIDAEQINVADIDTTGTPDLWLTSDDDDLSVGTQATVEFVLEVPDLTYTSAIVVNESDDSILTTLTKQRQTEDGTVELYGSYTFVPQEADFIEIRAYSGDKYSPTNYLNIIDPVTEDENDEFVEVFTDLGEYMENLDTDSMDSSDILDAVESWLNSNQSIVKTSRTDTRVYFLTTGGVYSYYTVETVSPYIMSNSSTSAFDDDTTTVDNYEDYLEGDLEAGDDGIVYDYADISITNNNTLFLRPTYSADDGFSDDWFDECVVDRTKEYLDGNFREYKSATTVMKSIAEGEWLDYGNIILGAHGNNDGSYFGADDAGNYLFGILTTDEADEWKRFEETYSDLISAYSDLPANPENDRNWMIFYYMSDNGTYHAALSSRYIMDVYEDCKLDNAAVWMLSCKGMSDDTFNSFLIQHGAQCMIGSTESIYFGVVHYMLNTVYLQMLTGDNNAAKLSNAWSTGVTNGICSCTITENDTIPYLDFIWYYTNIHLIQNRLTPAELQQYVVNGCIADAQLIEEYLEYQLGPDIEFTVDRVYTEAEDGKAAGSFDFTYTLEDTFLYRTANGDFTYQGSGDLSGTVVKGETVRTIHSNGTYEETDNTSDPLSYATITAYQFLNQKFTNKSDSEYKDEATTDKDGKFTFTGIDWGLYAADVEFSSYSGEASIILTADSTDGGQIIARGGTATLTGYVQGYTNKQRTKTEILKNATVTLTSVEEVNGSAETYTTATDKSGYFEITDIAPAAYTITISHDDYEEYSDTLTLEKGYVYNYELGCFILENSLSDTDIVFVLDVSGSMAGTPISTLKSAVRSFADSMIGTTNSENCRIAVVAFSDNASTICGFTKYKAGLYAAAAVLSSGGGTDAEDGLSTAYSMLRSSEADNKVIVLMSDGCPNQGKEGDELISYASTIKQNDITICTQGFFSELSSSERAKAQSLMNGIASTGFHYEINSVNDMVGFYDDLAEMLSGQQYDVVRAACPVDITVTYNGETLSSAEDSLCTRTSFGTISFEEDTDAEEGEDSRVKVLRLKSGPEYDIQIIGTGNGTMDYTVSYMDKDGEYTDVRSFESVPVTDTTAMDTVVGNSGKTVINIDSDGDGKYDTVYQAKKNSEGKETSGVPMVALIGGGVIVIAVVVAVIIFTGKSKKKKA